MTTWSKRKCKKKFKVGDIVSVNEKWMEYTKQTNKYDFEEEFNFYKGPLKVVECYIERGGEIIDGDEGYWWGDEIVKVVKIINNKEYIENWKYGTPEWRLRSDFDGYNIGRAGFNACFLKKVN